MIPQSDQSGRKNYTGIQTGIDVKLTLKKKKLIQNDPHKTLSGAN